MAATPFLHVSMDVFIDMLPGKLMGNPHGMIFDTSTVDGRPVINVRTGPAMERAMDGMRHAIAAMAARGNNLVVDDVMLGKGEATAYRILLAAHRLLFVGLYAVLEAREQARGDRQIGLARGQVDRVHAGMRYDLEIDTDSITAEAAARRICNTLAL